MIKPFPKPNRLPVRKIVTIAAGFNCQEGIVLCADSEEHVGNFLKRSQPKIVVHATGQFESGDIQETRAVFACAGHGPFIDMAVEKLWAQMKRAKSSPDEVIAALEDELIRIHQRYWPLYATEERPEMAMLIALYTPNYCPSLWKADGPILTQVLTYDCIGFGLSLGKYIGDRLYNSKMETTQAALLAIYLLEQAKKAVQYCGGQSHVIVMPLTGWVCRQEQEYVDKAAAAFQSFEDNTNRLLLSSPAFKYGETELLKTFADHYEQWPEFARKMNGQLSDLTSRLEQLMQRSAAQKSTGQR